MTPLRAEDSFMYISSELKAFYKSYTFATNEYRAACGLGVVCAVVTRSSYPKAVTPRWRVFYDSFLPLRILALKEHLTILLEDDTLLRTNMYKSHVSMR